MQIGEMVVVTAWWGENLVLLTTPRVPTFLTNILCSMDTFMLIRFTLAGPFVASLRGETYQVTIYYSTEDKVVATDD